MEMLKISKSFEMYSDDIKLEEVVKEFKTSEDFESYLTPDYLVKHQESLAKRDFPDCNVKWTWEVDKGYKMIPVSSYQSYSLFGLRDKCFPEDFETGEGEIVKVATVQVFDRDFKQIYISKGEERCFLQLNETESQIAKNFFKRCLIKNALRTNTIINEFSIYVA